MGAGGAFSTANWSEVAQRIRAHGRDWSLARALLASYGLRLEPVSVDDAEHALSRTDREPRSGSSPSRSMPSRQSLYSYVQ